MINLYNADCIEQMQKMIDEGIQVDSIVTDPPYHLSSMTQRYGKEGSAPCTDEDGLFKRVNTGFMGKEWDGGDIAFRKETWELCLQLLKPGGHLLAFSGSRTYHRMAVAVEDAGFEIRDQIMWLYGSGFPKSHNIGNGWGTALKPAHEPVVMARKPFKGSVADNVLQYGTGAINIDESRISLSENDDPRLGGKGTWKTDKMAKDVYEGGYAGTETGSSELGRFPANLILDGIETEWSRYFYSPKVSSSERNQGLDHLETKQTKGGGGISTVEKAWIGTNSASGKYGSLKAPQKNTHPTVKPVELMKYLCRLVTPKGGTVLDPFMGSGSTGIAAKSLEFNFIGIEREEEYYNIASERVGNSSPLDDFFS
jgi:site-specific DNA-methyltransferase (adenine-specific)